jgi:hypothetical protein
MAKQRRASMRVVIRTNGIVEVTPKGKRRADKCRHEGLCGRCLQPLAGPDVRGNHPNCARTNYRRIADGHVTDEELVKSGIWFAPEKPGPKPKEPMDL